MTNGGTASGTWDRPVRSAPEPQRVDALQLGKSLRHARKHTGLTLDAVHAAIGLAPSQLSGFENGRREARFSQLQQLSALYGVSLEQLTGTAPPSRRAAMELRLERAMQSSTWQQKRLPTMRIGPRTPDDVLATVLTRVPAPQ